LRLLKIIEMARICDLTGKRAIGGNSVSFSNKKTKRKFNPNLQVKKFYVPELGEWITLKVSTSAIRTINKLGISAAIEKAIRKGSI
jgi:large subunit ribosomal protein L28